MSHVQSVDSYAMLENSTLEWPISTTESFLSPSYSLLSQTETEEKIELKSEIFSLKKESQLIEQVADQIQRLFLGIYHISDRLMDELLAMEAAKQMQLFRNELVAKMRADYLSPKRIGLLESIESKFLKIEQEKKSIELNMWLGKDLQSDIPFTYPSCDTHLITPISTLCEIREIRRIYLLGFAIERLLSEKIRMINNQIQLMKKELKLEKRKITIKNESPLEMDRRNLKIQIKNQEEEREEIQKTTWEIQNLLKKSCFLSTSLMYHILSPPFPYEEVDTLIQKRTSFRNSLLTQVEKLIPGEKAEAVREPLRKIKEEELQASEISELTPNEACRNENRRTILYHQLASEITKKSNQTIDSIDENIKNLKERLKLLQVPSEPQSLKLTASLKVLSTTALIGYGLGGVAGLSMVTAIVGCVFWLNRKQKAPQRGRLVSLESGENAKMIWLAAKEKN